MKPLYQIKTRLINHTTLLSVVCFRGKVSVTTSEKVIPPILEYAEDGTYTAISAKQVINGLHFHPYKPNSKDFNRERLADLEVASLFSQLQHFPTLPNQYIDGKTVVHPIAEMIYGNMVYMKPTPEFNEKLQKLGFITKSKLQARALSKLVQNVEKDHKIKLDLYSVPKRKVGSFAYIADKDGIAKVAKLFSFGMHNIIPADRIAREISSLKACEKFLNPVHVDHIKIPNQIKDYVTTLRVAIVGTKFSMLDSADLYESALPKLACRLTRKHVIRDVSLVPPEKRNLVYKPFRSGVEVYHEEEYIIDESEQTPGTIRLIFPAGVKVAAQYGGYQAKDEEGKDIDVMLGFETFAKKGALACFMFEQENPESLTIEKAKEIFRNLPLQKIVVNNTEYEGWIVDLPVMRPGQRYTELSKPSQEITVDLIAKAILSKNYKVRESTNLEYTKLRSLRNSIIKELEQIQ